MIVHYPKLSVKIYRKSSQTDKTTGATETLLMRLETLNVSEKKIIAQKTMNWELVFCFSSLQIHIGPVTWLVVPNASEKKKKKMK